MRQYQTIHPGLRCQVRSQRGGEVRFLFRPFFGREKPVRKEQGTATVEIRQGGKGVCISGVAEGTAFRLHTETHGRHGMARFADGDSAGTNSNHVPGLYIRKGKAGGAGNDLPESGRFVHRRIDLQCPTHGFQPVEED